MNQFTRWLQEQMQINPHLNQVGLAISIGASQSSVSNWLRGIYVPDPENCRKIARYFGVSEEEVLTLAGHLKAAGTQTNSGNTPPPLRELIRMFNALDDEDQGQILQIMRTFFHRQRASRTEQAYQRDQTAPQTR